MIESPIPSPCIRVCSIDHRTGWCRGCWRTGAEIGAWPGMDDSARRALLDELARRRHSQDADRV
ncbi:MAG TPA: DUF1289 domain-containing protein [Ferrovibrio sp.]|jgi:predicted Fe-S protein YdhL (DUF1289 family)|uniref:DUF1289 domain-containing protein n=1 Tax=Ferrovibrio sp. TaxID=1917215 RepID=UPI002B4B4882|nr:DUF1289 domain-containing protein [Ferrovibrio sp.]HLT76683.1 DUF1289 domain-containing protein [Ferrovibrio sp.]